jgi:hypothetical protein
MFFVLLGATAAVLPATRTGNALSQVTKSQDPIPGPRTCFWIRGPFGADPYINIAYPDANTFYWGSAFTIPAGAKLRFEGKFPHSRYMSFISYGANGQPVEAVADYLIKPQAGSINPFLAGADRTAANRSYSLEVVSGNPDPNLKKGMNLAGETRDVLHAPPYGLGQQAIIYRIYAGDKGLDETAGAGLPEPVLTMPDGKVLRGNEACVALRSRQQPQIDPSSMALTMEKYRELLEAAVKISPLHPATNPPTWNLTLGREQMYSIYTGAPFDAAAGKTTGGFYPNPDVNYIRTILNRKHGRVVVLRGKAPTTPKTSNGDAKMGSGELRYWSFCSNQGFANTRVNACVHDEQIPVGPQGNYTVVISRKADRPRNAITACGVAWLPMADDGDGAVDEDVTVVGLRHMLGTQDFPFAVQKITKSGNEAKDMGAYFPQARYMTKSAFEASIPCLIEKR